MTPLQITMRGRKLIATKDTRIVGPVHLHLTLSATAIDTNLMVRLSDVAPNGKRLKLAFAWLRGSPRVIDPVRSNPTEIVHDHHAEAVKQLVPGVPTQMSLSLTPLNNMFLAGHRLSLEVGARLELLCSEKGEDYDMFLGIRSMLRVTPSTAAGRHLLAFRSMLRRTMNNHVDEPHAATFTLWAQQDLPTPLRMRRATEQRLLISEPNLPGELFY